MKDDFEATFVVDLAPAQIWETLTAMVLEQDADADGDVHYVLPGFPSP